MTAPRPLIIGNEMVDAIRAAVERARAKPIPWEKLRKAMIANQASALVRLADRAPLEPVRPPSEMVELPMGFRLNVSFEEQPAGMCLHLSMSVDRPGALPNPAALDFVSGICVGAADVGNRHPRTPTAEWVEEFLLDGKPGGLAANRVYLISETSAGHA